MISMHSANCLLGRLPIDQLCSSRIVPIHDSRTWSGCVLSDFLTATNGNHACKNSICISILSDVSGIVIGIYEDH